MVRKKGLREVYRICTHPLSCHFEFWVEDWHRRLVLALVIGSVLSVFTQIYPVCTQDTCYNTIFELLFNPALLFKPFALTLLIPQFMTAFVLFTLFWFAVFSIFGWFYRKQKFPELTFPIITIALFIYLFMLTSGALTPFVVTVGGLDCVTDDECIRAGYVGEVCTSVYKPVYTEYSPDLEPLTKCSCIENKCVGE